MEDENRIGIGEGKQRGLDELQAELEKQRQEQLLNSRFLIIDPGKQKILHFTGNVFERTAIINGAPSEKLDFELEETTPSGEHKVFSVGKKSRTARELVALLKQGKRVLSIARSGSGTNTRYQIFLPD
jgi:hypothetical protein